jgi:acyl-coenzyme A thioesterase PaaI-like protein
MPEELSLQERLAPQNICFGCGPSNPKGLQIRSFPQGDEVVCDWQPQPHHRALEGVLNGGIIGTLLDCHSNWTAIWYFMQRDGLDEPPSTVTAEYAIQLKRPTPTDGPLHLVARVVEASQDRVVVGGELSAGGIVTATSRGTFVRVRPGHPAYYRW